MAKRVPKRRSSPCLTCSQKASRRGLCGRCYSRALYAVTTSKATWGEIIATGMALAPHSKPQSWYAAELVRRLANTRSNQRGDGCQVSKRSA